MENETLLVDVDNHVATITLNRPGKKNAITQAMWLELAGILARFAGNPDIRVAVLTGAGGNFSAGADIHEFGALRTDAGTARAYEAANVAAFAAVRTAPFPVIAAIRGICFGGGFGLAAAADLRLAAPDATFSVPAAKLGLAYPVDAMQDIVAALGSQRARHLAYSGDRLTAAEALSAGFLLDVVDKDSFDAVVGALARTIATNAPLSVRASKAAIRAVLSSEAKDIASARRLGDLTFDSADYAEGRLAFTEKRAPAFKGR